MSRICRIALFTACMLLVGCAAESTATAPWFDRRVDALVAPTMRKFQSAAEFDAYRESLWQLGKARGAQWARTSDPSLDTLMASTDEKIPCDPTVEPCPGESEEMTVTGSRIVQPSITNNQVGGVDEGDIVKQFGRFLIVLHDGRLFSIDTGTTGTSMALVDRIDVYRSADDDGWYDELLINDDELVVTGYDYDLDATQLSVFRIAPDGVFTALVSYYITSDDYYSDENYASRLVHGELVLYTPLYLTALDPREPVSFPRIRRWSPDAGFSEWQPLFGPTDVYAPIQRTLDPVVHAITVCPVEIDHVWNCRSTGVVGPSMHEFYVSPQDAFVWLSPGDEMYDWGLPECTADRVSQPFRGLPAALYRIPLSGGRADAVFTAGTPIDQFALDARESKFLALLAWEPGDCYMQEDYYQLRYARIPNAAFAARPGRFEDMEYTEVPRPPGDGVENRFTERYLVYAGSDSLALYDIEHRGGYATTELVAVPVDDPATLSTLALQHSANRIEVFGDNAVVDGYQTASGLSVTTIDLRGRPAIADTAYAEQVFESEGRSHAFNSVTAADGSGMFGIPTVFNRSGSDAPSNLHFFAVDPSLTIHAFGYLTPTRRANARDYVCRVSCVDWYGNARPIFMNGRIFALTGVELIEGYVADGQIVERQRVNMTGVPLHAR